MMLRIPAVLTKAEVSALRGMIDPAAWLDGNATSGHQSAQAKRNMQLPEQSPEARKAGDMIVAALEKNALFISGALPAKVFPPLFNRYEGGGSFGVHIDNAIRQTRGQRLRADLSATLFLTEPEDYDGGELEIEDTYGTHGAKLAAGDMILYPASSLHRVNPVTRGARVSSFFWIQSMVRDDADRALLFDLDVAIQGLRQSAGDAPHIVRATGVYHNLLRRWAEM
jgi:PKHD-type hydroxylase